MKPRRTLLLSITIVLALCAACGVWLHRERQQYARNRGLIDALTHNDTKTALALVNEGADPNTHLAPLPSPTFKLLFEHLLHHKSSPENNSSTAFILACGTFPVKMPTVFGRLILVQEDLSLLRAMLAHGANVNARDGSHRTALHLAFLTRRVNTVELLLQHGADANAQDKWRHPAIAYAAHMDVVKATRLLLSHGANPNLQDVNGNAWLYYALFQHYPTSVIPELLAHGADPNLPNKQGQTPLMLAQELKRPDLVALLKRGTK